MIAESPRQQAKREQIRAAARALFLRHGFAETSMDAVTAAAGVSKQTLYRYYETKAQLFAGVLGELIMQAGPTPAATPPEARVSRSQAELEASLVVLSERFLARLMKPDQLALLRVVIAEGSRFPELTESFRSTVPAAEAAAVAAVIEGGMAGGLVAKWVEVRTAARALAALLLAFVFRDGLLAAEPRLPARHEMAEMVHIFVRGIGARPRASGDGGVSR